MNLSFVEEFTSSVQLDAGLMEAPDSGYYWNRGVHPTVTINNLINLLPTIEFTFAAWSSSKTYKKFDTSKSKGDIVIDDSKFYLSLLDNNLDNSPIVTDTEYWLETNIESLRIRAFIWSVEANFTNELNLSRKLIENQYIYNVGETSLTLPNDWVGWVFEPKGSDYVKIRINQMALQANTTDPVNVYVINQGQLIETIILNPNNGILEFEDVGYTITGKGRFLFVFRSQEVLCDSAFNDPLKYDGFVCYPISGVGSFAKDADYSNTSFGNGLNFNISVYLDASIYVTNNKVDFGKFLQAQFEYDFIRMLLHNSNAASNRDERAIRNEQLLATEIMSLDMNTVARKYLNIKKEAIEVINRTFDKFLNKPTTFKVRRRTI